MGVITDLPNEIIAIIAGDSRLSNWDRRNLALAHSYFASPCIEAMDPSEDMARSMKGAVRRNRIDLLEKWFRDKGDAIEAMDLYVTALDVFRLRRTSAWRVFLTQTERIQENCCSHYMQCIEHGTVKQLEMLVDTVPLYEEFYEEVLTNAMLYRVPLQGFVYLMQAPWAQSMAVSDEVLYSAIVWGRHRHVTAILQDPRRVVGRESFRGACYMSRTDLVQSWAEEGVYVCDEHELMNVLYVSIRDDSVHLLDYLYHSDHHREGAKHLMPVKDALRTACDRGSVRIVLYLMDTFNVSPYDLHRGDTGIAIAVKAGNTGLTRMLLAQCPHKELRNYVEHMLKRLIETCDPEDCTQHCKEMTPEQALGRLADGSYNGWGCVLKKAMKDPRYVDWENVTNTLSIACQYEHEEIVRLMLEVPGIDPTDYYNKPMQNAVKKHNLKIIEMLAGDDRTNLITKRVAMETATKMKIPGYTKVIDEIYDRARRRGTKRRRSER